ncbi:hypothetical protein JTB14_026400 [Gonioctena quinquepunctata]|nr:hypothetical protein JTB14_026400 [Gonioctena quinquepunctata]
MNRKSKTINPSEPGIISNETETTSKPIEEYTKVTEYTITEITPTSEVGGLMPTEVEVPAISTYIPPYEISTEASRNTGTVSNSVPPENTIGLSGTTVTEFLTPESMQPAEIATETSKTEMQMQIQSNSTEVTEHGTRSSHTVSSETSKQETSTTPVRLGSSEEIAIMSSRAEAQKTTLPLEPTEEQLEEFAFTNGPRESTICETCSEITEEILQAIHTTVQWEHTTQIPTELEKSLLQTENMKQLATHPATISTLETTKKSDSEKQILIEEGASAHTLYSEMSTNVPEMTSEYNEMNHLESQSVESTKLRHSVEPEITESSTGEDEEIHTASETERSPTSPEDSVESTRSSHSESSSEEGVVTHTVEKTVKSAEISNTIEPGTSELPTEEGEGIIATSRTQISSTKVKRYGIH